MKEEHTFSPKEVHVLEVKLLKTSKFTKADLRLVSLLLEKEGYLLQVDGPFLKEEEE